MIQIIQDSGTDPEDTCLAGAAVAAAATFVVVYDACAAVATAKLGVCLLICKCKEL